MSAVEITEVVKYLQHTVPFQFLDSKELNFAASNISISYLKNGRVIDMSENERPSLHLIRRGAFEIRSEQDHLVDRIADGECYGISTVLDNNPEGFNVVALEDSLVYILNKEDFQKLSESNTQFYDFFNQTRENRLRKLSTSKNETITPATQLNNSILSLMAHDIIHIEPSQTIGEAARLMTERRVSSLLILEEQKLIGILTDRDLRSRVLACGKTADTLIEEVMTRNPTSVSNTSLSIHAQLLMSEKNIHHLPVVDENFHAVGMLTSTDLLRNQQLSPLLMVSEISRQNSLESASAVMSRLPKLINNLVASEMKAADIGDIIAAIADSLARKLIGFYQEEKGPAPMEFNLLVFGSQARFDQSLGSDQDNALMLERQPTPDEMNYFIDLGKFLADGLNQCGFIYCPGDIMASNPEWIKTQVEWQTKFRKWIQSPSPTALLNASIFFDIRHIYGPDEPVKKLKSLALGLARKNELFIATMTKNAVGNRAPLGFFRDFVVDRSGSHKDQLDLKHHGLALINDLARVYSLASGCTETSTIRRLRACRKEGVLAPEHANNLKDAWEFLADLRLQAQQKSWQEYGSAAPFMDPTILSQLERKHLKSTFKVITQAQESAQNKFARGLG